MHSVAIGVINGFIPAKHSIGQIRSRIDAQIPFVIQSNIMAIISRLRKKLEVNPSSPKYIQTVKGIGYRFNKEV